MLTDATPRKANRAAFLESDRIRTLDLPQHGCLLPIAKVIESAMKNGTSADVRRACAEFLNAASGFYKVPACGIRVLAARPLRVRESWSTELFGDYTHETMLIRVWMRTAVRKEVTSFGTFTPPKKLFWVPVAGGRWRIDWQRTNRAVAVFGDATPNLTSLPFC